MPLKPLATWRAVKASKLVVGWFAGWHAVLPVLFARMQRKPSLMIVGGIDAASLPEIGYGFRAADPASGRRDSASGARARCSPTRTTRARSSSETRGSTPHACAWCTTDCPTRSASCRRSPRAASRAHGRHRGQSATSSARACARSSRPRPSCRTCHFVLVGRAEGEAGEKLRDAGAGQRRDHRFPGGPTARPDATAARPSTCRPRFHGGSACRWSRRCWPAASRSLSDRGALPEVVGDAGIVTEGVEPGSDRRGHQARAERGRRDADESSRARPFAVQPRRAGARPAGRGRRAALEHRSDLRRICRSNRGIGTPQDPREARGRHCRPAGHCWAPRWHPSRELSVDRLRFSAAVAFQAQFMATRCRATGLMSSSSWIGQAFAEAMPDQCRRGGASTPLCAPRARRRGARSRSASTVAARSTSRHSLPCSRRDASSPR